MCITCSLWVQIIWAYPLYLHHEPISIHIAFPKNEAFFFTGILYHYRLANTRTLLYKVERNATK